MMKELREKLCNALEKVAHKSEVTSNDLELVHMLTDTIKNIDKICLMEEDGGYSQAGDYESYSRGNSYANRGQHYVRGHYSRDGEGGGSYSQARGGYSRCGSYSQKDGRSEMMEHLEAALDSASEQDREDIRRFMRKIQNAE